MATRDARYGTFFHFMKVRHTRGQEYWVDRSCCGVVFDSSVMSYPRQKENVPIKEVPPWLRCSRRGCKEAWTAAGMAP